MKILHSLTYQHIQNKTDGLITLINVFKKIMVIHWNSSQEFVTNFVIRFLHFCLKKMYVYPFQNGVTRLLEIIHILMKTIKLFRSFQEKFCHYKLYFRKHCSWLLIKVECVESLALDIKSFRTNKENSIIRNRSRTKNISTD